MEWTTCAKVLLPIPFLPRMISRLSTLVPIDYSRRAAESFPNAMLQVLSGEGHMYSGQAVRQTIDSISDFFYTHLEKAVMPQS